MLLTKETIRPKPARFPHRGALDAAEQLGQLAAGDGPPQEVLHPAANGLDENRAFRHVGLEGVRPEDRRHGGFRRDVGRFLGKGLQGPNVAPHFHQRELRPAAPRRLDRLADVARVVDHRVQIVQRGERALQLFAEPRVGTHHQNVDCRRHGLGLGLKGDWGKEIRLISFFIVSSMGLRLRFEI